MTTLTHISGILIEFQLLAQFGTSSIFSHTPRVFIDEEGELTFFDKHKK